MLFLLPVFYSHGHEILGPLTLMIKQMPLAEEPNPGLHYREAVSKYCNAANQPHERKTRQASCPVLRWSEIG